MVEDNPGDVELTREALTEARVRNNLDRCRGRRGGAYRSCAGRGRYQGRAAAPDFVLLDLNLPTIDGREVLAEIKCDPELRRIPVVILSSSQDKEDILQTYDLRANAYVVKPVGLDEFMEVIKAVEGFWLSFAKLPTRSSQGNPDV